MAGGSLWFILASLTPRGAGKKKKKKASRGSQILNGASLHKELSLSPAAINSPTSPEPGQAGNTLVFKQDVFLPLPAHASPLSSVGNYWTVRPSLAALHGAAFLDHSFLIRASTELLFSHSSDASFCCL